jgi:hypothetical protein
MELGSVAGSMAVAFMAAVAIAKVPVCLVQFLVVGERDG